MPFPPPSKDIEEALLGLAAILERAVSEVHRVIDEVKSETDPPAGSGEIGGPDDV